MMVLEYVGNRAVAGVMDGMPWTIALLRRDHTRRSFAMVVWLMPSGFPPAFKHAIAWMNRWYVLLTFHAVRGISHERFCSR
jgi:hypothetical protein